MLVTRTNNERPMTVGRAAILLVGLMLSGCMQSTLEPTAETNFKPRDKQLLANAPYAKANIPLAYQRTIVPYHRKEAPGTIVVDTDERYLYYVMADGRAIRKKWTERVHGERTFQIAVARGRIQCLQSPELHWHKQHIELHVVSESGSGEQCYTI